MRAIDRHRAIRNDDICSVKVRIERVDKRVICERYSNHCRHGDKGRSRTSKEGDEDSPEFHRSMGFIRTWASHTPPIFAKKVNAILPSPTRSNAPTEG